MNYELYFDGSYRNGIGYYGGWIRGDSPIKETYQGIIPGMATNNVSEYYGLIKGLEKVIPVMQDRDTLKIYGDSQLVICQLTQRWRCNLPHLQKLRNQCMSLLDKRVWRAVWIPRKQNKQADILSRIEN